MHSAPAIALLSSSNPVLRPEVTEIAFRDAVIVMVWGSRVTGVAERERGSQGTSRRRL